MIERLDPAEAQQTAQALAALLDLKEKGALTEEEFNRLKMRLLEPEEPTTPHGRAPMPSEGGRLLTPGRLPGSTGQAEALVSAYTGDIHRLIVRAFHNRRPTNDADARVRMEETVSVLAKAKALTAADVPLLNRTIRVVCDADIDNFALLREVGRINDEARLSTATSDLGRALTAIAFDSAQTFVLERIATPSDEPGTGAAATGTPPQPQSAPGGPPPASAPAPAAAPARRPPFRLVVRDDFMGALFASGAFADQVGLGTFDQTGFSLAGVTVAAAGVTIAGTLLPWWTIAVLGGGAASGLRYFGWWSQS
jgi:hypothetical protein